MQVGNVRYEWYIFSEFYFILSFFFFLFLYSTITFGIYEEEHAFSARC